MKHQHLIATLPHDNHPYHPWTCTCIHNLHEEILQYWMQVIFDKKGCQVYHNNNLCIVGILKPLIGLWTLHKTKAKLPLSAMIYYDQILNNNTPTNRYTNVAYTMSSKYNALKYMHNYLFFMLKSIH